MMTCVGRSRRAESLLRSISNCFGKGDGRGFYTQPMACEQVTRSQFLSRFHYVKWIVLSRTKYRARGWQRH
jgi:hypothetical protein